MFMLEWNNMYNRILSIKKKQPNTVEFEPEYCQKKSGILQDTFDWKLPNTLGNTQIRILGHMGGWVGSSQM